MKEGGGESFHECWELPIDSPNYILMNYFFFFFFFFAKLNPGKKDFLLRFKNLEIKSPRINFIFDDSQNTVEKFLFLTEFESLKSIAEASRFSLRKQKI